MIHLPLDPHIVKIDKYYRLALPRAHVKRAAWISGTQPFSGWLLLENPGRCRVLSTAEVKEDKDLQTLQSRIAAEISEPSAGALEFHDEVGLTLALRFVSVEFRPPGPQWRLALPKPVAAIMDIRAGESEVVVLFVQNHIEIWTLSTLKSATNVPLTEFV